LVHIAEMFGRNESAGLYTPQSLIRKRKVYTTIQRKRNYNEIPAITPTRRVAAAKARCLCEIQRLIGMATVYE
jgi:hypothetical protein